MTIQMDTWLSIAELAVPVKSAPRLGDSSAFRLMGHNRTQRWPIVESVGA